MRIHLCSIAGRSRNDEFQSLASLYLERITPYARIDAEIFRNTELFWSSMEKLRSRTMPFIVLLDSRGKQFASEALAEWMGARRDEGVQNLVFAIGPADGWDEASRKKASLLLSFGAMTLPHELARVILAEQIYRAFTILAGHPYHTGH